MAASRLEEEHTARPDHCPGGTTERIAPLALSSALKPNILSSLHQAITLLLVGSILALALQFYWIQLHSISHDNKATTEIHLLGQRLNFGGPTTFSQLQGYRSMSNFHGQLTQTNNGVRRIIPTQPKELPKKITSDDVIGFPDVGIPATGNSSPAEGSLCADPVHLAKGCQIHALWNVSNRDPNDIYIRGLSGSIRVGHTTLPVGRTYPNESVIVKFNRQCQAIAALQGTTGAAWILDVYHKLNSNELMIGLTWGWPREIKRMTQYQWHSYTLTDPVAFLLWENAPGLGQVKHEENSGVIGFRKTIYFGPLAARDVNASSFSEVAEKHVDLTPGSGWRPEVCVPRWRIAIIIPFRARETHLWPFLDNIITFLQTQQIAFNIFVIEQTGDVLFNRAALMNIGYLEANKSGHYECYVFHDVDLIPEDLANSYGCSDRPRHMSVARSVTKYRLRYKKYFGGSISMRPSHIELINGFPNSVFGWGGEDDEIYARVYAAGMRVMRFPTEIARYYSLPHGRDKTNPHMRRGKSNMHYHGTNSMHEDGLNSVNYTIVDLRQNKLFSHIYVHIPGPKAARPSAKAGSLSAMVAGPSQKIPSRLPSIHLSREAFERFKVCNQTKCWYELPEGLKNYLKIPS